MIINFEFIVNSDYNFSLQVIIFLIEIELQQNLSHPAKSSQDR